MILTLFFIALRFLLDIYAIFVFVKVIEIYLIAFGIIGIHDYLYFLMQFVCSFLIDPLILAVLFLIPWLDNELVAFAVLIFFFYHLHRLINILAVGEDDSKITR